MVLLLLKFLYLFLSLRNVFTFKEYSYHSNSVDLFMTPSFIHKIFGDQLLGQIEVYFSFLIMSP